MAANMRVAPRIVGYTVQAAPSYVAHWTTARAARRDLRSCDPRATVEVHAMLDMGGWAHVATYQWRDLRWVRTYKRPRT
jgi:hypothetical protein